MARLFSTKIVSNLRVDKIGLSNRLNLANGKLTNKIPKAMIRIMKIEAPFKSGKLRNSIKKIKETSGNSGDVYNSDIIVGPTIDYAKYVIRRTGESQGAYVPSLKKRIKFGTHPGTSRNRFVLRSKPKIINEIKKIILDEYNLNRINVSRFLRNG